MGTAATSSGGSTSLKTRAAAGTSKAACRTAVVESSLMAFAFAVRAPSCSGTIAVA